jgi:hypothetical protein
VAEELPDIGVESVINMHVVGRSQTLTGGIKDTSVDTAGVGRTETTGLSSSRRGGHLEIGEIRKSPLFNSRVMLPEIPSKLATSQTYRVEVRRGCVVAKGSTSIDNSIPILDTGMHRNEIRIVSHKAEGTTHIVVTNVDFFVGIGNPKIVDLGQEFDLSGREGQIRFIAFVSPIVNRVAPRVGPVGAIEDGSRILVDGIEVNDALRSQVAVQHKEHDTWVKENSETLLVVLDNSIESFAGVVFNRRVIAVLVVSAKIILVRRYITIGRDAINKNSPDIIDDSLVDIGGGQLGKGRMMVTMGANMWPSDPPN